MPGRVSRRPAAQFWRAADIWPAADLRAAANPRLRSHSPLLLSPLACRAMRRRLQTSPPNGYSLPELLFVVSLLAVCLVVGSISLSHSLSAYEARASAQGWQAACAWAQTGVLWQGGAVGVSFDAGSVTLSHDLGLCGGDLEGCLPVVPISTNVTRWNSAGGARVTFSGALASPDGGGSIFFYSLGGSYRVTVRPESGLTVRTRAVGGS
jgi:type II secretory pathway pseudopilin PulG